MSKKQALSSVKPSSTNPLKMAFDAAKGDMPPPSKKSEVLATLQGAVSKKDFMGLTIENAIKVLVAVHESGGVADLAKRDEHITLEEMLSAPKPAKSSATDKKEQLAEIARFVAAYHEEHGDEAMPTAKDCADALGISSKRVEAALRKMRAA